MGQAQCCHAPCCQEAPEVAEDDPGYQIRPSVADGHMAYHRSSESIWSPLSDYLMTSELSGLGQGQPRLRRRHSDTLVGDFFKQLVTIIWPQVASVAARLVEQQFSESLKELKTRGADLVSVVRNMHLDFGRRPPEIRKLLSCRKVCIGDEQGVEICCHLHWRADANMELSVGGMKTGLKGLSADGLAGIVFTPLLADTPIIGGCHFFFCNVPKLELNLTGLANVLPKRMLQRTLKSSLRKTVVLPNRLAVRAGATVIHDVPAFKSPPPIGILRVHIIAGRNIMSADWWGLGSSDPYCIVGLGMQKHRTATRWDDQNPEWGECVDLLVYHHRQLLKLKVFDEDKMKKDDPLGCILPSFTVARLLRDQRELGKHGEQWIPIETKHLQSGYSRLLGRRQAQDKAGHKAPSETRSAVCLRVQYFRFRPRNDAARGCSGWNDLGPIREAREELSVALPSAEAALLSVKLWRVVGSQACLEKAKGAKVSLSIGGASEDDGLQTGRCRQVPPMESHGCAQRDVEAMRKLAQLGIGAEDIASTLGLSTEVVRTLVEPSYVCIGWNSTLHALVPDAQTSVRLSVHIEGRWFSLCEPFVPAILLQDSNNNNERRTFKVANWPHGDLEVEASIGLSDTVPVPTQSALEDFDAFDMEGEVKPSEQWLLGTAPEQERNLRPGLSDDNL